MDTPGLSFQKMFDLMEAKGVKKFDLRRAGLHTNTLNRMMKGQHVNTSSVLFVCKYLHCTPGDIMDIIWD